jgi:hypothetical protein
MDDALDPPNELIDTTCLESRSSSIGTLTAWQQLAARQLAGECGAADDDAPPPPPSPRSQSFTSGRVAARPHQLFYKEYRLQQTISKGAFGTVSIATRRADGKQVVAKEIELAQTSLASDKQRAAIMGEVQVLARLKHPNIVRFLDSCFLDEARLIIIMEYCSGGVWHLPQQFLLPRHVLTLNASLPDGCRRPGWPHQGQGRPPAARERGHVFVCTAVFGAARVPCRWHPAQVRT